MASAATTGCQDSGAFAGYCGTQLNGNHLSMNVKQNVAQNGRPIVGYAYSAAQNEDFTWVAIGAGDYAGQKEAIYSPNGVLTNLCLANPLQSGAAPVQLRFCNRLKWQAWSFNGNNWVSAADGNVISESTTAGSNLLTMVPPVDNAAADWTFATQAA
jgi:hypothetical protein